MQKAIDFTFNTADEQNLVLSEEVKKAKYTFLIFLRYYGCTSCQIDLIDLAKKYDRFLANDAQILVVLQSRPETLRAGIETRGIPFRLISDPGQQLYPLYKVYAARDYDGLKADMSAEQQAKMAAKKELAEELGVSHGEFEGNEYQLPAYFLLDSGMNVLAEHWGKNIADMPYADGYLALLP